MNVAKLVTDYISDLFFAEAQRTVEQAQARRLDNTQGREWAVKSLQKELLAPEHIARLLVELAVLARKHEGAPGAQ